MKRLSKFLSVLIGIVIMLSVSVSVYANTADQATLDARNGVVKVLIYYNDNKYPSAMGSGFLINEDTIVTAAHNLDDSETAKVTKVTVVAVADIEIEASKLSVSGERDFAVLKLAQKINQRSILPLGTPNGFDTTSAVYALGFPYVKEITSDKINYSPTDVVVTEGAVSSISNIDNVKFVQHSAKLDSGNSGGPLIYSTGSSVSVVGVNVSSVSHSDSTYYYSVHIDELIEALDTLGIEYTAIGTAVDPSVSTEGESEEKEPSANGASNHIGLSKTAIIIIAAVIAAIIAVLVIVYIVVKKKNSTPVPINGGYHSASQSSAPITMTGPNKIPSGDATTVLGSDPNATTVLNANASSAYLFRLSNNERIPINKSLFKIGKDASRVDYCITGNSAISRYHAAIISRDGKYFIEDQGATNHTYVNDSMIPAKAETQLTSGAKIRLADEKFEFRI